MVDDGSTCGLPMADMEQGRVRTFTTLSTCTSVEEESAESTYMLRCVLAVWLCGCVTACAAAGRRVNRAAIRAYGHTLALGTGRQRRTGPGRLQHLRLHGS